MGKPQEQTPPSGHVSTYSSISSSSSTSSSSSSSSSSSLFVYFSFELFGIVAFLLMGESGGKWRRAATLS